MGKQTTRETLIEVGLGLIHTAGYTATGINQVLEAAKVPKGSFYHHFTTKDEFVLEVIQRYAAGEQERWERLLDDSNLSLITEIKPKRCICERGTGLCARTRSSRCRTELFSQSHR
jgi:TetR/AcrR family transcriptional repressor of nem operon